MTAITQRELRNDSGEVLRRVEAGEQFTVTRRGVPVADLVPHRPPAPAPSRFVPSDVVTTTLADLPPMDVDAFMAERREFDSLVDDDPSDPWTKG